jgi:hypothetical protein
MKRAQWLKSKVSSCFIEWIVFLGVREETVEGREER